MILKPKLLSKNMASKSVSDFNDLCKKIKALRKSIAAAMPSISAEIDSIIETKENSVPRIEKTLDTLLGLASLGYGEEEFQRLNLYYATINKPNAEFYQRYLEEELKDN